MTPNSTSQKPLVELDADKERYEVWLQSTFKEECVKASKRAGFSALSNWVVLAMKNELARQLRREAAERRKK